MKVKDMIMFIILVIFDQVSKILAFKKIPINQSIPIIKNFFYLTQVKNEGAAWGILPGQMWFFYVITIIGIIMILKMYHDIPSENRWLKVAMTMILSGAVGNFIDRVFLKYVRDFLDFKIFGYDFPVFNLADSILVIGVLMIIAYVIFVPEGEKDVEI